MSIAQHSTEKHVVRTTLPLNKVPDKQTSPSTGTLKLLALLHFSYYCTCSAFQCGVVVILPAAGVKILVKVCSGSRANGELSSFLLTDILK